ncbi:hypothetical protein Q4488_15475 [Amphritea sp. 1_MG-2023]|uniref:hypothetical protein n=1 Tax=Amphritea sp. 1_MG-2023 TaxID=3062670 RepID=UPI0026E45A9A|nr:hypothetical protein [Amphritea sp. 1_MG-2023]MDO6564784.1 hypothetical protein [Amphritea sp. 1_MG-2023]
MKTLGIVLMVQQKSRSLVVNMKKIKAIVLTYDKYRSFTDHMILCYEKLWPQHPFIFQVPYQDIEPTILSDKVDYIKCPSDIKGTVLTLLKDLDDETLVYWCIDDKYPIYLNVHEIEKIHSDVCQQDNGGIDGVLFCRCRGMLERKNLVKKSFFSRREDVLIERKNYQQIWLHQYLKVKVIRNLFKAFPDSISTAKVMDSYKDQLEKPADQRIYVTRDNFATFGESTSRGVVTENCFNSMKNHGVIIPEWVTETTKSEIIMG